MKYKEFFKEVYSGIKPTPDINNVDSKELEVGMRVEKEHTDDESLARTISLQHLAEDPHYYSKLKNAGLDDELQTSVSSKEGNVDSTEAVVEPNSDDVETKTEPGTVYKKVENNSGIGACNTTFAGVKHDVEGGIKTDVDAPSSDPTPTNHITGGMSGTPSNPNILSKENGCTDEDSAVSQMSGIGVGDISVGISEAKKNLKQMFKASSDKKQKKKMSKMSRLTKEQWAGDPDNDKAYVKGKRWTVKWK